MTKVTDYSDISKVSTDKLRKIVDVKNDRLRELSQEIEELRQNIIHIKLEIYSR